MTCDEARETENKGRRVTTEIAETAEPSQI
jgi:hypothetical protein